ncbi:HAMP domain-containing sensor histidine kinase [uncultured Clostridium sp.]|uniref:HAMP domain-containing sensor histidine kinase n=1 Tax=uncultured Clostridium sp. TaxID=59620 RepID=UPI0028EA5CF6|nr:HAMP domain-containing sensor histidine kinase [uncultured Clostridium sp.]
MKEYFINPELKKSSVVLVSLMSVFLIISCFVLKYHHHQLKEDYVKSLGAIAARVIEKDPDLEKEIMPLIVREASEEEMDKGKAILIQYGVSKNLENQFFPYINKTIQKNNYYTIFIFIVMIATIFIINYFQHISIYKKIRRLTLGAKKVIDGEYDIAIEEDKEGDFSKLATSFNSMREIIRNNLEQLQNEKEFLVNLLSDISHQLKTPLSSMIVYNDIMLKKDLTKEQREVFLVNNQNQLNRMEWLIKSILKLAKLDANAIEFHKENLSLNDTLNDSLEALESKALEKELTINIIEKEDMFFLHDKLWVEEALINIIKNSIEHSPKSGEITIELSENLVYRRVAIADKGEGIREEDLPNIFKRFYKGKTSKKTDSVGIGLALAKSIIESHNGTIEVKSTTDVGTTFIVSFFKY